MFKKGDTLVEVALAVGIFSMVAIAVAAVLSSSTSGAQTALETTLTREEIDTQAEALRFIQTSYAVDRNETKNNKFYELWHAVTSKPYNVVSASGEADQNFLNYAPTSCSSVYESDAVKNYAFIINPRALGAYTTSSDDAIDNINQVILRNSGIAIPSGTDSTPLQPANIYPRLIYQGSTSAGNLSQQDALISATNNSLYRAEGIYVVAVQDYHTTEVVDYLDGVVGNESAFYDFYIRSCWYGTDANQPSTISTVIRLYDPDVLQGGGTVKVIYHYNRTPGEDWPTIDPNAVRSFGTQGPARKATVYKVDVPKGWTFDWLVTSATSGYSPGSTIAPGTAITNDQPTNIDINLRPHWEHTKYTVVYHPNDNPPYSGYSTSAISDRICYQDEGCRVNLSDAEKPVASGYKLSGWCSTVPSGSTCSGKTYDVNLNISSDEDFSAIFTGSGRTLNLYPIWRENNETITIALTWNSAIDYDSYIAGTKSNGAQFIASYRAKNPSETVSGVTRILASLNHDCTGSCKDETFTINTLGGRNYYYYVRNYSNDSAVSGATVTVSGDGWSQTFSSNNATGSGRIWNVFAYKDGEIIPRQTRSGGGTDSEGSYTSYDASY